MRKILLLLFIFLSVEIINGQQITLSNNAEISVLTIGSGASLNDAFGHSAYRIYDPSFGLDITYGYGEFDFNTPNFYLKFAQGKLKYSMGKIEFQRLLHAYKYFNRTIKEQVLNLSQSEKQKLYDLLIENYKPENRAYLYEFFFDNCATRIRDIAQKSANNQIQFNITEGFEAEKFRTLIHGNLNRNSWGSLGIDIALGSVIDKTATPEEHMFLPKNIYTFFENATINNKPLVEENRVLYSKKEAIKSNSFFTSPLFILGLIGLFILFITYKDHKNNRRSNWLDVSLFIITGFSGILILLLWFATDHIGTHQNYNLLWAFALNIFMIGQLFKKQVKTWFIKYLKFLVISLCLLTLHWVIGVQVFAIGLIPIIIALFIRYIYLVKYYNRKITDL